MTCYRYIDRLRAPINRIFSDRQGFTLLELIAVMVILGLLAALAIPRYMDLEASATTRAIDAAVSELNGREAIIWGRVKTTGTSYMKTTGDDDVWGLMLNDPTKSYPYLGEAYQWSGLPDKTGGSLTFKNGDAFTLSRSKSTIANPAHWRRLP